MRRKGEGPLGTPTTAKGGIAGRAKHGEKFKPEKKYWTVTIKGPYKQHWSWRPPKESKPEVRFVSRLALSKRTPPPRGNATAQEIINWIEAS